MEVHKPLPSMPHTMIHHEDMERLGHALRQDQHANPTLLNETMRSKSDSGYSLPTPDDSPPRIEEKRAMPAARVDAPMLSTEDTHAIFKAKVEDARRDTQELAGSEEMSQVAIPKLTLDLGNANISRLPESVVDLIKDEVERLSLLHNQIWHIPQRFSECSHLRYLNIRSNVFRDIPKGVYKLPLLEILDISRNKIRKIPTDISNLTSLRVFSVVHNRIEELPTELCEMTKLQVFKVAENPLKAELKRVIEVKEAELDRSAGGVTEREQAVTAEIKRYLRDLHPTGMLHEAETVVSPDDTSMDLPKPIKRSVTSRFPVVPSSTATDGTGDSTRTSPNQTRPPPIPTRSHQRGVSGQSVSQRRTGITPFMTSSERNRSNSEAGMVLASATARQRRMGMLRKERTDLDAIDETKASRQSHLRGFSHGSVLRRNGSVSSPLIGSASPGSPRIPTGPVMQTIRRLSSLPEGGVEPPPRSPIIDGAKGILYALHQIETQVRGLLAIIEDHEGKGSGLELTFYNASKWLRRLNKSLERATTPGHENSESLERAHDDLQQNCTDCVDAYKHVISQMQENVKTMVAVTDPLVIRTFLLLLFGSYMEIKNAMRSFGLETRGHRRQMSSGNTNPIQTIPEEFTTPQQPLRAGTPNRGRNITRPQGGRFRSDTTLHHPSVDVSVPLQSGPPPTIPPMPGSARLPPSLHLTGSTVRDGPPSAASSFTAGSGTSTVNMRSRSNSRTAFSSNTNSAFSSVANTPRSGEGFHLPPPSALLQRINPATGLTDGQEETLFETIYIGLSRSYEAALQALPVAKAKFQRCLESAEDSRQSKEIKSLWQGLIHRCNQCREVTENLRLRLTEMPHNATVYGAVTPEGGRNDPAFWMLCKTFLSSFVDLVTEMRVAKDYRILPPDILVVLRPVQKTSRDVGRLIETSPWTRLTDGSASISAPAPFASSGQHPHDHGHYSHLDQGGSQTYPNGLPGHHSLFPNPSAPASTLSLSTISAMTNGTGLASGGGLITGSSPGVQLPATPLSAALGPAAQATIPNVPASAYGDQFFKGDVFQRADSLLSMPQAGSVNFLNRR